jgi:hypothetical protein
MKSSRLTPICLLAVLGLLPTALSTHAQTTTSTSSSMTVKQLHPKPIWLKGEVIHADANSIIVREQSSERSVHTFTYDSKIKDQMQKVSDKGGYQSGDKVKILYTPGQTVALKVHGKPSKPN